MERCLSNNPYKNAVLWLEKLEKNEREVGVEKLRTAYGRGYAKMLEFTRAAVLRAETEYLLTAVPKKSKESVRRIIAQMNLPWKPVLSTYDIGLGFELLVREWYKLQMQYYVPWWLNGTHGSGKRFFNAHIEMWWDGDRQCWLTEDRKTSVIMLPPTAELCEAHFKQVMKEIPESPDEIQLAYANRLKNALFAV